VIGSIVLHAATHAIAIGALDLELREGDSSRWICKVMLLGEGMRIEADARLAEGELPAFGAELGELASGQRDKASLASEDGALYLAFEARSESELTIAVRLLRDRAHRVISVLETRMARADAYDVAAAMRRFPYG
jgi:hypothetical protein